MIIDGHVHWFQPQTMHTEKRWDDIISNAIEMYLSRLNPSITKEKVYDVWLDSDGSKLIKSMDEAGVDMSVVLPIDYVLLYGEEAPTSIQETNNMHGRLMQKYPDRIVSFYGIDPRREYAIAHFREGVKEWGFKGLKLYPPCNFLPTDVYCYDFYHACIEFDIPVIFHGADSGFFSLLDGCHPKFMRRVLEDLPELKLIYAHAGGTKWFDETYPLLEEFENFYVDISSWVLATDEMINNRLAKIKEIMGNLDKVFYGSDGPVYDPIIPSKDWLKKVQALDLPKNEMDGILGGNIKRLLKI